MSKDNRDKSEHPWAGRKPTKEELEEILTAHKIWVESGASGWPPNDLTGIDLSGVNLRNANLSHADLNRTNFSDTNLCKAVLEGVKLQQANLDGANLSEANLLGANLTAANLQSADFTDANLYRIPAPQAKFTGAKLTNVNLEQANLYNADFQGSDLSRASLYQAGLSHAILHEANLLKANLIRAKLDKANVSYTNLRKAILAEADLTGAYLYEGDLRGAKLYRANFERANVAGVKFNRWAKYQGIRVATCYGNQRFRRFAQDQEYIEEFRSSWWRKPLYWLWLIFADCGRSFSLWAVWSVVFALMFGLLYAGNPIFDWLPDNWKPIVSLEHVGLQSNEAGVVNTQHRKPTGFTLYYFSIVTFTTLGFGDVTPLNLAGEVWITIEVILGYIMLGGLISILANKLARRS